MGKKGKRRKYKKSIEINAPNYLHVSCINKWLEFKNETNFLKETIFLKTDILSNKLKENKNITDYGKAKHKYSREIANFITTEHLHVYDLSQKLDIISDAIKQWNN